MGWIIFLSILAIIVIALALSLLIDIRIDDEIRIKIKYAWVTIISISPEDTAKKKAKKKVKKKPKEKAEEEENKAAEKIAEDTEEKSENSSSEGEETAEAESTKSKLPKTDLSDKIEMVKMLLNSAGKPMRRLFKHIRINVSNADITVSGKDAAKAALNYGKVNWAAGALLNFLGEFFTLNIKRINIGIDFVSGEFKYILDCKIKLRVSTAIGCALWFAVRYLKAIIKNRSKQSGAGKVAPGKGN